MLPPSRATIRCEMARPTPLPGYAARVRVAGPAEHVEDRRLVRHGDPHPVVGAHHLDHARGPRGADTRTSPSGRLNFTALSMTLT